MVDTDTARDVLWRYRLHMGRGYEYKEEDKHNFFRFEGVPVEVIKGFMVGAPLLDPQESQNDGPTAETIVNLLSGPYRGTVEGYMIPPESGRKDARITLEGFTVVASELRARRLRDEVPDPSEFGKAGKGRWRFWWD